MSSARGALANNPVLLVLVKPTCLGSPSWGGENYVMKTTFRDPRLWNDFEGTVSELAYLADPQKYNADPARASENNSQHSCPAGSKTVYLAH